MKGDPQLTPTKSPSDPGSGGSEDPALKRVACIECRQQKVRCDAHERWPEPCSKCAKKSRECKLDTGFKRTSKRQKFLDMEREMEELRRMQKQATMAQVSQMPPQMTGVPVMGAMPGVQMVPGTPIQGPIPAMQGTIQGSISGSGPPVIPTTLPTVSGGMAPKHDPAYSHIPIHQLLPPPTYFPEPSPEPRAKAVWHVSDWTCTPKTIDGFTLSSETIANLFREFVDKYHPFLPVVDVSRGPERIYSLCPSLFWTIMTVASRRYDKDGELMMQLTPLLRTCLAEITISPVTRYGSAEQGPSQAVFNMASVYSVQAFLICTMWPPLTSTISADSSWNSAGIAMFSAIRVGLHCPGYARDFARIKQDNPIYPQVTEQVRTWICCNIVSQSVAGMFGFPSFTSFDATVLSACQADSGMEVPESIRLMMLIQRLENAVEKALNSNLKDAIGLSELSERLSIIKMMAQNLDELELTLKPSNGFDDLRRFMFLVARMHLMTYYFLDNDRTNGFEHQRGLVQAYNSALAVMDHCDQVCRRDKDFMRYLPQVHVQLLWQATAIINKIYHSSYARYVDTDTGKRLYTATALHVSKASILKHDVPYRAGEIMQQMWQVYDSLSDRPESYPQMIEAKVSIRTRLAASVFFDCLWTMREQSEIRSVAPTILNQRTTSSDDDSDGAAGPGQSLSSRSRHASGTKRTWAEADLNGSMNRTASVTPAPSSALASSAPTPSGSGPLLPPINGLILNMGPEASQNVLPPVSSGDIAVTETAMPTPASTSGFGWDVDLVWKDVDSMMNDFGFRVEEVASLM